MSLRRDAAVSVLHHHGVRQGAAWLLTHCQHPEDAIVLVVGALTPHA